MLLFVDNWISVDVLSNSSLFSLMKFRCIFAIWAMIRSRRFEAISDLRLLSLSSFSSFLAVVRPRAAFFVDTLASFVSVWSSVNFWTKRNDQNLTP